MFKNNIFKHIIKKLNTNAENNPKENIPALNAINTKKSFKQKQKKISTVIIIQNIKGNLKEIRTIHKRNNNAMLYFQEKFSIENTLCSIEYNNLTFNF